MISVEEAENIINSEVKNFGTEIIPFERALGRVLAEDIKADRDLPPFNRVTMDGIAISFAAFENGLTEFKIIGTQAAGDKPIEINKSNECVEIMTGTMLPSTTDTIVRYEDIEISDGWAKLTTDVIKKGQNIHYRGNDKYHGEIVAHTGDLITPSLVNLITSVGEAELCVKKVPRVVIISSGNELVDVRETPSPYQIRRSNNYTLQAVLKQQHLDADTAHIPDDSEQIIIKLKYCLENYDAIILSGGVSMGKLDYIPAALETLKVRKLFHKVSQRPGKPFWFGKSQNNILVFAFPGNPVASFMCMRRYFLPWLNQSLGLKQQPSVFAVLNDAFEFPLSLKYFLQVKLSYNKEYQLTATPIEGNGSGDFANLADTDAFMELPLERDRFEKGEAFRIWHFS